MTYISKTAKIHPNVKMGKNCIVGEYVVIGEPPRNKKPGQIKTKIGDNAIIRSHTVIYAGNYIGDNFQTGHAALLREENKIKNNVSIGSGSIIEHHVEIGSNVRLHSNVFVPEYSVLEEGCWLGPNVVLTNAKYPLSPNVKKELKGAIVKTKAKIGANATVLAAVVIGENALVGAGSVVTKDVPPDSVVVGNPARVIKKISELPYK